jgi:hypothetical protein
MKEKTPLLLLLALMGLALWPLPQVLFSSQALGHPTGDLADHLQGSWWFGGELLSGRWPSISSITHYPEAPQLWYIDPIGGLFAGVLFRPLGPATAWNMALLLQLGLTALVAWKMGMDLLEKPSAALVVALCTSCSAPVLGFLHSGLSECIGLAPAVGLVWASIRAMGRDPRGRPIPPRAAIWMGLSLSLCMLQTPYYGVFGGLWLLCLLPGPAWKDRIRPLGLALGIAALPTLLLALGISASLAHANAAIGVNTAPGWSPATLPATDLLSFVHPGPWYHPDTPALGNPGILHISYLGLGAIVLLLWKRAPCRGLGMPTLLFGLLCLGPVLSIARWSPGMPLPMALLFAIDSPLRGLHHPYRIIGMALPLLGLWLGLATLRLRPPLQLLIPILLVAETLYISPAPWPLQTMDTEAPPIYATLPDGPVLDWPADASTWNRRYLVWQTHHEQPVAVGVNVFITPTLATDPLVGGLALELEDLADRARNRDVPSHQGFEFQPGADAQGLRDLGYRSLVLHLDALSPPEQEAAIAWLEAVLGPASYQSGPDRAWEL